MSHFKNKIVKKDRERFPGFALQNPALIDETTEDFNPKLHPLLKPATPLQEGRSRKRSRDDEVAREKRHLHIVGKYPYNVARKGTDTNPSNWTYQALSTKQDQMDLGRKWTKPQVPWH